MNSLPTPEATGDRQRRVRRMAGPLVGGVVAVVAIAVVVAVAVALPVLNAQDDTELVATAGPTTPDPSTSAPTVAPTTASPTTEPSTTSTEPPTPAAPSADEQLSSQFSSLTPEQAFAFNLVTSPPEVRAALSSYLSPPPPPPPPRPAAPRPQPAPAPPAPRVEAGQSAPSGFLACVRQRESGGNYSINTGNGYYGAYQFLPSTWNSAARHAGRDDLVGVLPSNASPADQDAVAQDLLDWQGRGPWAGNGC
jgi:hypothetical protein